MDFESDVSYLNFINSLGANDATDTFSWDDKYAVGHVLLSRKTLVDNDKAFEPFRQQPEDFICRILPNSPSTSTQYTQGVNPLKMSYMVGFGANYPKRIHQRILSALIGSPHRVI
ncbi:hypothetical protein ACSBR2_022196 [Camellia fascicularis]